MKALLHRLLATMLVGLAALAVGGSPSEAQLSSASGWPMLGYDARHTGQSNLLGPKFAGTAPDNINEDVRSLTFYDKIKMFPATGPNGEVYVGMGWQFCGLNALNVTDSHNPVFTTKWNQNPAPASPQGSPINTPSVSWPNIGCWPTNADVSASGAAVGTAPSPKRIFTPSAPSTIR